MHILNKRKLRLKEAKWYIQSHVAAIRQSQDSNSDLPESRANPPSIYQYKGSRDLEEAE